MSETKEAAFTPGPWRVVGFSTLGGSIRKKHYGFAVTDNFGSKFAELTIEPLFSVEVQQANSRLIAAAPQMYKLLADIETAAHRAANGGLKVPGRPDRVADCKAVLRTIAEHARAALRAAEGKPE